MRSSNTVASGRCLLLALFFVAPQAAQAQNLPGDTVILTSLHLSNERAIKLSHELAAFLNDKGLRATIDASASQQERQARTKQEKELRKSLKLSVTAMDNLEIDDALSYLRTFRAHLNAFALQSPEDSDLAHAGILRMGITYQLLGSYADANLAFQNAIALQPDSKLPLSYQNPTIETAFEKAKQALLSAPQSSAAIQTSPKGATILHNGRPVGRSPLVLQGLPPGTHFITATHPNQRVTATQIVVTAQSRQSNVMLKLHPNRESTSSPSSPANKLHNQCPGPSGPTFLVLENFPDRVLVSRVHCSTGLVDKNSFARDASAPSNDLFMKIREWLSSPPSPLKQSLAIQRTDSTHTLFWTTTAAGTALISAGAILGYLASQSKTEYYQRVQNGLTPNHAQTTDQVEGVSVARKGRALALSADISIAAGLGTLITAALWRFLWAENTNKTTPKISATGTNFEVSISF